MGTKMISHGWVNTTGPVAPFPSGHPLIPKGTDAHRKVAGSAIMFHFSGILMCASDLLISELTKREIPIPKPVSLGLIGAGAAFMAAAPLGGFCAVTAVGLNMLVNYSGKKND